MPAAAAGTRGGGAGTGDSGRASETWRERAATGDAGTMPVAPVLEVEIPVDERPLLQPAVPPPPISGGTLLLTRDATHVVAADPDRDRVSIVSLADWAVSSVIALAQGDEPGRSVEDDAGRVHVALRRGGAVVSIDLARGAIVERRAVCGAPRGIAFQASDRSLIVACASGELIRLPVEGGSATLRARLPADLRDVVILGVGERERIFVTRFKSAELLVLTGDGVAVTVPRETKAKVSDADGVVHEQSFVPRMAWRTIASSEGGLIMLHQGARSDEVELEKPPLDVQRATSGPYGSGGGSCGGVVQNELTYFDENGVAEATVRVPGLLGVDVAESADGRVVAVAFAGGLESGTPLRKLTLVEGDSRSDFVAAAPGPSGSWLLLQDIRVATMSNHLCVANGIGLGDERNVLSEPIALVRNPNGGNGWLIQNREPAALLVSLSSPGFMPLALAADSVADTGHALFHHDGGGGIACASCHGEGAEDGHVWRFTGFGPRRTQALNIGLEGTAPFHWNGDMSGIGPLLEDVLVERMGGVHQSPERVGALERWLFSLKPPPPQRAADDLAALRGRALFEGQAECATCHAGGKLTNNLSVDVGTGEVLQVPSLAGVGYRAPWLHTGCASTLRDRFDPACGGEAHGAVADLDETQLADLVAYLETL